MFSYDNFKSFVRDNGIAKQNRFYVRILPPAGLSWDVEAMKKIDMLCKSVSLPGINVVSSPVRYTGEVIEVPYDRNFSGATVNFYVDREMKTKSFFDDWINIIQNTDSRVLGYRDDYLSKELSIVMQDKQDKDVYAITLYDLFPKTIGTLSLDHGISDTMVFDVTFEYRYYKIESLSTDISKPESMSPSLNLSENTTIGTGLGSFNDIGFDIETLNNINDISNIPTSFTSGGNTMGLKDSSLSLPVFNNFSSKTFGF